MTEPKVEALREYIIVLLEKNLKMESLLKEIHDTTVSLSLKFKINEVLK
jgi:hypothetical protein